MRGTGWPGRILITQALSRFPPKSLLGRLFRLPLGLVPGRQVLTVKSGLNQGMRWIAGSSIHGCWLGHYESEKQEVVRQLVKPGMKVLDIGANAGFYALAFSRIVGASGHVWALEPFAENAANILRHLELNAISNVTLLQTAVSDKQGFNGFEIGRSNSMGKLADAEVGYLVPTTTLDELMRSGQVPLPDFVKMDVEGAEVQVLQGAKTILEARSTTWLIALHGDHLLRQCMEILDRAGYGVRSLDGRVVAMNGAFVDEVYAVAGDP